MIIIIVLIIIVIMIITVVVIMIIIIAIMYYNIYWLLTSSVFLDISKAFDTVLHKNLRYKLKQNGVSVNLLNVVNYFLCQRKQKVFLMYSGTPEMHSRTIIFWWLNFKLKAILPCLKIKFSSKQWKEWYNENK